MKGRTKEKSEKKVNAEDDIGSFRQHMTKIFVVVNLKEIIFRWG